MVTRLATVTVRYFFNEYGVGLSRVSLNDACKMGLYLFFVLLAVHFQDEWMRRGTN